MPDPPRSPRPPGRVARLLERKRRALEQAAMRHWRLTAMVVFGAVVYVMLGAVSEQLPSLGVVVLLTIAGLPLALLLVQLYAIAFARLRTFAPVEGFLNLGREALVLLVIASWAAAIGWFAACAYLLLTTVGLDFETRSGNEVQHAYEFASFFTWQFLDQLPLLGAIETLQWEVPLTYSGTAAGLMVLAFKLFVIVPGLAAAAVVVRQQVKRGRSADADVAAHNARA